MANQVVHQWLARRRGITLALYTMLAAFSTYFCMYAFRKPFSAGEFNDLSLWGMDYKIILILSQVAGYTLSKFIGIRVIAEMPSERRVISLIGLILFAEASLVGLGLVPYPYNFVFMFLNGLPLGMIWGLVFAYLEGRRYTDALAAGLCASFIVSSGVVKAVGKFTMESWGVSEFWMPAVTGLIFLGPMMLFIWMLSQVPPPDADDETQRTRRVPMNREQRLECLKRLAVGISLLVFVHMLLTALRDYRDLFAVEILGAVGADNASSLSTSELPIVIPILLLMAAAIAIHNHKVAVTVVHTMLAMGFVTAGLSTLAFRMGWLPGFPWYIAVGLGLYLAYVPFQSILFERLIALFRHPGNAGFLIYIADSTGYLSSVAILLYKNFGAANQAPIDFFVQATYFGAIVGGSAALISLGFFLRRDTAVGIVTQDIVAQDIEQA